MSLFNKFDQVHLSKRLEKLKAMTEYLSLNCLELPRACAPYLFEWLEFYKNILSQNPMM